MKKIQMGTGYFVHKSNANIPSPYTEAIKGKLLSSFLVKSNILA